MTNNLSDFNRDTIVEVITACNRLAIFHEFYAKEHREEVAKGNSAIWHKGNLDVHEKEAERAFDIASRLNKFLYGNGDG